MNNRLTKIFNRSILAAVVFASMAIAPQLQILSQPTLQNGSSISAQRSQTTQNPVVAVDSVGMTVSDMDRSIDFYTKVLSFKKVSDVEVLGSEYERLNGLFGVRLRVVKMQLCDESKSTRCLEQVELTEYLTPKGKPIPIDSRSNDRWFQHIAIVVSDMDAAYQHLRQHKIQHASTAPQRLPDWNKAAAGIRAFYFKDPDGHNLEIIYFPPGKGNAKWQQSSDRLFLGIDHTAIAIANTATSLKFYRDVLGLKVAGASTNYGTEQAHLNNVDRAKLQITGLRSPAGVGIEFLEYLQPRNGRDFPIDARSNDLIHWQTTLVVKNARSISQRLHLDRAKFISPDVVTIPDRKLGFKQGFLVRDPDGHVLRIVEQ